MSKGKIFNKPTLSILEQIKLLEKRDLIISDHKQAEHFLKYIGYYRFSGYLYHFRMNDNTDNYQQDLTFNKVVDLYVFDRKLRILTFDSIEKIEIALRSIITETIAKKYGSHWFLDSKLFQNQKQYKAINNGICKATLEKDHNKRDVFIRHYYENYSKPELPPSWMVFETLSMGSVSLTLKFLNLDLRKEIAQSFGVDEKILTSWIHALVYTRNLCAHHSRLWNRVFTIKPIAMKRYRDLMIPNDKFHAQAVVIEILLKTIEPESHWKENLLKLFEEYPDIDKSKMGFNE